MHGSEETLPAAPRKHCGNHYAAKAVAHQVEPDCLSRGSLKAPEQGAATRLADPPTAVLHLPEGQHPQRREQAPDVKTPEADIVSGVPYDPLRVERLPI